MLRQFLVSTLTICGSTLILFMLAMIGLLLMMAMLALVSPAP
jgi:hypothetical protein